VQILDYEQLPFKCRKCHVYGHFARNCPTNAEPEKGKEEGWNQVKRAKINHKNQKPGGPLAKGLIRLMLTRPPPKTAQENKFDPLSQQRDRRHTKRDRNPKVQSSRKGTPQLPPKELTEDPKGKTLEDEEEEQETEESEEEGEIGESQTSVRRSTRGRKTDKEKREQETYKDKLQGSQPTLGKTASLKAQRC
jgi:hypothetical protein